MDKTISEIIKRFGIKAIIFVLLFSIAIWGLAHFTSAPGKEISILWGFVKYTKKFLSITPEKKYLTEKKKESTPLVFPEINLTIKHNVTKENINKTLNKLRSESNLRELTLVESNKKVQDLPEKVYFYLSAYFITSDNTYSTFISTINNSKANRYNFHNTYFECHNMTNDNRHIIGFISEIQADDISKLFGKEQKVIVSPYPWGQFTSLVSLPMDRIKSSQYRTIEVTKDEAIKMLDMVVQ